MDDLEERHKVEKKELQAQIQKIKHAVPKGDKKRQKESKLEIARLEAELSERHQREMRELQAGCDVSVDQCASAMDDLMVEAAEQDNEKSADQLTKKSKAAKRRDKKEREEREREARIAQGLAESVNSARNVEQALINSKLSGRGLSLYDIPSDGDCLYKAIAHQLSQRTGQPMMSVGEMRRKTAETMRASPDDYLPFLTSSSGDTLDSLAYEEYLTTIESSHEWGGHVEMKAMSAMLGYPILVLQADQPDIDIDSSNSTCKDALVVVYHKTLYGLGEHYSSVTEVKS